jgi:NADPH-dependent curcumin reductase CurA
MQYLQLLSENKIHGHVDPSKFSGLDQVAAAVDYMYSGKNVGKVVVDLPEHSKL